MKKSVLLTFDIEEFDMPNEYGMSVPLNRQLEVSAMGTATLLDLLQKQKIKATFFSTAVFANNNVTLIKRIVSEGHELASHSYAHSHFEPGDLLRSKKILEDISEKKIAGFRMPRMMHVDSTELTAAGYTYNASINPVFLPGRYNNVHLPRTIYCEDGLIQVPASATPLIRFPLFWLSFHLVPLWIYNRALEATMKKDHCVTLYFHPWEFIDLSTHEFKLPKYLTYNTGGKMIGKFTRFVNCMNRKGYAFTTVSEHLKNSIEA